MRRFRLSANTSSSSRRHTEAKKRTPAASALSFPALKGEVCRATDQLVGGTSPFSTDGHVYLSPFSCSLESFLSCLVLSASYHSLLLPMTMLYVYLPASTTGSYGSCRSCGLRHLPTLFVYPLPVSLPTSKTLCSYSPTVGYESSGFLGQVWVCRGARGFG